MLLKQWEVTDLVCIISMHFCSRQLEGAEMFSFTKAVNIKQFSLHFFFCLFVFSLFFFFAFISGYRTNRNEEAEIYHEFYYTYYKTCNYLENFLLCLYGYGVIYKQSPP